MFYRRFHPRFSLRTLAIIVTLICAYFGVWEVTKRYGTTRKTERIRGVVVRYNKTLGHDSSYMVESIAILEAHAPAPFMVSRYEQEIWRPMPGVEGMSPLPRPTRNYYLWLFGPTFKLPD